MPEWLNSTMWSAPPPPSSFNDDGLLRNPPSTKMSSMKKDEEAESISVTPPPSTASSVPPPSPRPRNGSSISGEYGNSSSVPPSSAEDFSRQAHLSAEVNCNLYQYKNLGSSQILSSYLIWFDLVIEEGDQYEGTEESCFTKFA